jgi:Flp pilus assembly protein CpaB
MRLRTFLLLILVLVVLAVVVVLFVLRGPGGDLLDIGGVGQAETVPTPAGQAVAQEATPVPEARLVSVVVARVDLPVGERLTRDLVRVERRPETSVAVVAGVTFDDPDLIVGQIVKTAVARGQAILRPMLALNPTDISNIGSDLGLYVDQGRVAVAFPIDRFSGASYAMRPGDRVDAIMSLTLVDLDPEFNTALPNVVQRVFESALLEGQEFLFPPSPQGRLELIPLINAVALIGPGSGREPIPRRATQLTVQQMEVLWVGTWRIPAESMGQAYDADAVRSQDLTPAPGEPAPFPTKQRPEDAPDLVILSMTAQDALALNWALNAGIDIRLALRAPGDNSLFVTTSVSLPTMLEQGVLTPPEPSEVGLEPRIDELEPPSLPVNPP